MAVPRTIAAAACALLVAACGLLVPREYAVSEAEIQSRLARRFPVERTVLGLFELQLANPVVRLDAARNRVFTDFDARLRVRGSGRTFTGRAGLSGLPRYDAGQRAFFLGSAAVDRLEIDGVPPAIAERLHGLAASLAPDLLEKTPIYALRPDEGRILGTEMTATGVRVAGDRLVVDLAPR